MALQKIVIELSSVYDLQKISKHNPELPIRVGSDRMINK